MNTGNILLGDSTLRNPNPTSESDYNRSEHRIRLLGESTSKSFGRNGQNEYFADLWDDGIYTTPTGRVGFWCLNGHGPACEWEVCRTPFVELYDEIPISHPTEDLTNWDGYFQLIESTVVEAPTYLQEIFNQEWQCNCEIEMTQVMGDDGAPIYQGTDFYHVGNPHDAYAGVIQSTDDNSLYLDILDYNCQNMCIQKQHDLNSHREDNLILPNACFAELPALTMEPDECIDNTDEGLPRLKVGLNECSLGSRGANFMVGFLRDMSEFTDFGYQPSQQGSGIPHIWDSTLVNKDIQGTTQGIFMGIGKVDSYQNNAYEIAYWWSTPTNLNGEITSEGFGVKNDNEWTFTKIPDSIFSLEYSSNITMKSGRFVTEGGQQGDWFIDISKCAHTSDWDLVNWDPLKAMIQSAERGIDDPMLGHNWEKYGSREAYAQACLDPSATGLGQAMEYSSEIPSAGKIAFLYDSGTYSLDGVVADYDILDATIGDVTLPGLGFGSIVDVGLDTFWLSQFSQLEGWYPESWHWAAFGVPLTNTLVPYESDYQQNQFNFEGDQKYCGCYGLSYHNRIYNVTQYGSLANQISCGYENILNGAPYEGSPSQFLGIGNNPYPNEWDIRSHHCFSSEFIQEFVVDSPLVAPNFDCEDDAILRFELIENDSNYFRPEVPVQITNEDSQTMTDSNSLKFSDFPNIRKYALRLIGNFGSVEKRDNSQSIPYLSSVGNSNNCFSDGDDMSPSDTALGTTGALWKGQLKQIFTGQAFCDNYDVHSDEGKRCGIRRWDGSYGKSSIGMGDANSGWADRIGGPPITDAFTYSKVMDYLYYVSNKGEYTSLFRKQDDGSLVSPVKDDNGNVVEGKQNINKNYKFYPGCPGPTSYGTDEFNDIFGEGFYDLLTDELGESLDYLGLQGIKSTDNYYLSNKDALGASDKINTFIDGDKAHWCGPTLSADSTGDGSWFTESLVGDADLGNNQIGTFYNHHAGWGGFQSGTSCIDWAYTQLIMHYPATNYYGKGQGTINDPYSGTTQYDLHDELAGLAGQTDWNGGRASARIAEIKSPLPNNMWGGNDDIEGVGTDIEGDYNPLRVRTKIHYNFLNSYYDEACPQWGCASFQGSDWERSDAWCGDMGWWYGTSRCYCRNTVTGEEIYNSNTGECGSLTGGGQGDAEDDCDDYCNGLNDYSACNTGTCETIFENLYSYCVMRNSTFSSPIPDKCHGMVRPAPRPWNPYLNLNDMKAAYLVEQDSDEVSGDAVAVGWKRMTQSTWDIVPLPFGWWGGYKQGFVTRDGEDDGTLAADYYGDVSGEGEHVWYYHALGDSTHGIPKVGGHPESSTMRWDTSLDAINTSVLNPTNSQGNIIDEYADYAGEAWSPVGIGNDMYVPTYDGQGDYGDFSGGVPHSCNDFCSDHYCKSCGYPKGWGTVYLDGSPMGSLLHNNQIGDLGDDSELNQYWTHDSNPISGRGFLQTDTRFSGENWHGKTTRFSYLFGNSIAGALFDLGYWNDEDGKGSETLGDNPFCLCKCERADSVSDTDSYEKEEVFDGTYDFQIGASNGGQVDTYFSKHDWSNSTFWKQFETQQIPACSFDDLSAIELLSLKNKNTFWGGNFVNGHLGDGNIWRPWYMLDEGTNQCIPLGQQSPGQAGYGLDTIENCLKGGGIPYDGCHRDGPNDKIIPEFVHQGAMDQHIGNANPPKAYVSVPDNPECVSHPNEGAGWCCGANYRYLSAQNQHKYGEEAVEGWQGRTDMPQHSLNWRYMGHEIFVQYDDDYGVDMHSESDLVDILPESWGPGHLWNMNNGAGTHNYSYLSRKFVDSYGHMADDGKPYSLRSNYGGGYNAGNSGLFDWPKVRKPYQDLIESCNDMGGTVVGVDTPLQKTTLAWNADLSDIDGVNPETPSGCGDFCGTEVYMSDYPIRKWDAKKTVYKYGSFMGTFRFIPNGLFNLVFSDLGSYDVDDYIGKISCNTDLDWILNGTSWCDIGISSPCDMFNNPSVTNNSQQTLPIHQTWFDTHYMDLYNDQISWTDAFYAGLLDVTGGVYDSFGGPENRYGSSWDSDATPIDNFNSFFQESAQAPFLLQGNWRECGYPTHIVVPAFSFPSVDIDVEQMSQQALMCADDTSDDDWIEYFGIEINSPSQAWIVEQMLPDLIDCVCNQGGNADSCMYRFAEGGSVSGRGSGTRGTGGGDTIDDGLIADPGGNCCDEGAGSYGPAICDSPHNTITGLSSTDCHSGAYIPAAAYEQHVGSYCHDPQLVSGPCVCSEDCSLYFFCNAEFQNYGQYITPECIEWSNTEPFEPGCPVGYITNSQGDCVLEEPPPPCDCCPESFGSGTYTCELDPVTGDTVLIDNCNYEHGAMMPVPPLFANLGICGLSIGQHDNNPLNESGLEVNDFSEEGAEGQGVSVGTWACGCDCLFPNIDENIWTVEEYFPFNNGYGTTCDGSIDIFEYFKCAINISWLGQAKHFLENDQPQYTTELQRDMWFKFSDTDVDSIDNLDEYEIATMNCNQAQGEGDYSDCSPFYKNYCEVFGCMNELADNYNPQATDDDGFDCTCSDDTSYEDNVTSGCLNPSAGNYDDSARCDCAGNNCMEGSACLHDGYQGYCRDYPWLCDTSCCIAVQDSDICGDGCQEAFSNALYNHYTTVAHRIISWTNLRNDIVNNTSLSFNSNISMCFEPSAGRLYGSDRLFSTYAEMIAAGYNEYGCPQTGDLYGEPIYEECRWTSGIRGGQNVVGMLCVPGNGGFVESGEGAGGEIIGGLRNQSEFGRISKDDLTYDPIQPD